MAIRTLFNNFEIDIAIELIEFFLIQKQNKSSDLANRLYS